MKLDSLFNKFSQTILVELEARKYAQGNETSGLVGWALFAENNLNIKGTSFRAHPILQISPRPLTQSIFMFLFDQLI